MAAEILSVARDTLNFYNLSRKRVALKGKVLETFLNMLQIKKKLLRNLEKKTELCSIALND